MPRQQSFRPRQRPRPGEGRSSYDESRPAGASIDQGLKVVLVCVAIFFIVACAKLFYLTLVDGPFRAQQAKALHTNTQVLQAKRGTIYDRNGNVLATSVECRTLYTNPKDVRDPQAVAQVLAQKLGGTPQDYLADLTKDSTFVYLKRKVDTSVAQEVVQELAKQELTGVYSLMDMKRVYPYGAVAGQVIGLVGSEGEGRTGLELQYNDILSGTNGERITEIGPGGIPIANGAYSETPAKNGTDIVVSLDINIQQIAEKQISEGVSKFSAESGFAAVTDPSNGEILAMCTTPFLNPEDTSTVTPEQLTLRTVTDSYEPGSVMKVLTTAIGIENGSFNADTVYNVPGTVEVGSDAVHDDDRRKETQDMTVREIIRRSSNVGAVLMARSEGAEAFSSGLSKFGIGSPTGIDYPGEVAGIVTPYSAYTSATLGAMSFGQAVALPPVQMMRAVSAIANKGTLTTPHFLIYKGTEQVEWPTGPQACSEATAQAVTDIMRTVVQDGTAKNAGVKGYDIAAKTGTGEQADESGGYKQGSYFASLVGFAPASDAKVLVYVALNGVPHLAADSAAPVFSAIMGESLMDMGVDPTS